MEEPRPLRRSDRHRGIAPRELTNASQSDQDTTNVQTPPKRHKKQVDFSEPRPKRTRTKTTGLTPAVQSSSLGTPARKDKAKLEKEVKEKDEELKRLREELEKFRQDDIHNAQDDVRSSQHIDQVESEFEALTQSFNGVDSLHADDALYADGDMDIDWSQVCIGGTPTKGGDTISIHEDKEVTSDRDPHPRNVYVQERRLFQDLTRHVDAPERAMPGQTTSGFENTKVLPELMVKLKSLIRQIGERDAALKYLKEQHRNLRGNFEHAIIAAEKANARAKELEASADTAVEEMLNIRMRSQQLEKDITEKDKSTERLVNGLEKHREDVLRIEALVSAMERESASAQIKHAQQLSDMVAKVASEKLGRRAAEDSAIARLTKIQDLEKALKEMQDDASKIDDPPNASLNSRISILSAALACANAEVDNLKITKTNLEQRVRDEVEQGQIAMEAMQLEFEMGFINVSRRRKGYVRGAKARVANFEMEEDEAFNNDGVGRMTPASLVRFVDVDMDQENIEGLVEVSRGMRKSTPRRPGLSARSKGRRQCDSGIGLDTLSEDELEQAFEDSDGDLMTPDLISKPDLETGPC